MKLSYQEYNFLKKSYHSSDIPWKSKKRFYISATLVCSIISDWSKWEAAWVTGRGELLVSGTPVAARGA